MTNEFYNLAKKAEPQLVKYLRDIVAIPSLSSDEGRVIHRIEREMRKLGFDETRVDGMGNLIGRVGSGPRSIALDAHIDTVDVTDEELWETDPFDPVVKDGRVFGRGTADMKGFAAVFLSRLASLNTAAMDRPLYLALSYDEEVGCLGAPRMIADIRRTLPKADIALIGEPSNWKVVNGHKGGIGIATGLRGYEVHSSILHTGVNAVMEAAKLVDCIVP